MELGAVQLGNWGAGELGSWGAGETGNWFSWKLEAGLTGSWKLEAGSWNYHPQVLDELARHGLRPGPTTSPQRLRDALRDLYKYEIKRLRGDLLANRIRKTDYADHVIQLRTRYPLLSIPLQLWTAPCNLPE